MTPDEGVEAFRRVLAAGSLTHLVHSTADLEMRLDQWIRRTDLRGKKTSAGRQHDTLCAAEPAKRLCACEQ